MVKKISGGGGGVVEKFSGGGGLKNVREVENFQGG